MSPRSPMLARVLALVLLCAIGASAHAQDRKSIRIGFVTFLSGPPRGRSACQPNTPPKPSSNR